VGLARKILSVCRQTRWNYSSDAFFSRISARFLFFSRLRNNCVVLSDADLISHAYTLAKLSCTETLYILPTVSSCIVERMAVHDTIGAPPLNFYMFPAAETDKAFSQETRRRRSLWRIDGGIKRMSRFCKQFLRNISYLVEEWLLSEIRNSER